MCHWKEKTYKAGSLIVSGVLLFQSRIWREEATVLVDSHHFFYMMWERKMLKWYDYHNYCLHSKRHDGFPSWIQFNQPLYYQPGTNATSCSHKCIVSHFKCTIQVVKAHYRSRSTEVSHSIPITRNLCVANQGYSVKQTLSKVCCCNS